MTEPLRVHVFVWSGQRTYGKRICRQCGSLERDSVHRVPERDEDERQLEARRVGERGDPSD